MTVLEPSQYSTVDSASPDEAVLEKLRKENRERKKKWREQNEERNKDNDLRCRVNKRAHKLFGAGESEEKLRWVQDEFNKRQQKRKEKERRRMAIFSGSPPRSPPVPSLVPSLHTTYTETTAYSYSQHAYSQQNELPPIMKSEACNITLPPMVRNDQYHSDFPIDAVLSLMELNGSIHCVPNVTSH